MKKILSLVVAVVMLLGIISIAAADVPNAEKPVIWYNRQPSNSTTGELDMDALTFNGKTYYVGFDAVQGAVLQGEMVVNYLKAHGEGLDRNGDGIIGYVLCIGDIGHNDSIARTRGPLWRASRMWIRLPSAPTWTVPPPLSRTAQSKSTGSPILSVNWLPRK